jgi:hypothetical protein
VELLEVVEIEGVAGEEVRLLVGGTAGGAQRLRLGCRFHYYIIIERGKRILGLYRGLYRGFKKGLNWGK